MEFTLARSVAILRRTPGVLQEWLGALPVEWVEGHEGGESWNPAQVVAHLIGGERTDWMARARIILAQGTDRRFAPFDRTGEIRDSAGRPLDELLATFASLRAQNLSELEGWRLTPAQLRLTGEHPEFGTVTLRQHLATWVVHDLGHLAQVGRVLARQYEDEVGPWRAYLPVLTR